MNKWLRFEHAGKAGFGKLQGDTIRSPKSFDGKVVFEGELGVVIGKACKEVWVQ